MILRCAAALLCLRVIVQAQGSSAARSAAVPAIPEAASLQPETPAPEFCPAGGPIGAVNLRVRPPNAGAEPLPLEKINNLSEGDTVLYSPILRGHEVRHGEVALVLVPVRHDSANPLIVSDPKPADKPQEWRIEQSVSLAAYVYGPAGLSKKKVRGFLSQDDLVIAQLADYAEKTAQTEALIQALSDSESTPASVNAALSGFASQYGMAAPIDKTAPPGVQAQMLFATMNPQLATYDPLTPSSSARIGQTASLATVAAGLFFGNPIGLAAGGTAMLLDLRSIAFPGTQFRSSFAQTLHPGLNLCGQRTPAPPHTRVAYIWANRIPNAPVPHIQIGSAHYIPESQKTALPVEVPDKMWRYLDRARAWKLEDKAGRQTAVNVINLANQKSLEIDLTKAHLAPGEYTLTGYWDWARFEAGGPVDVRPLSDFKQAKLEASSQDRLLAKTAKLAVTLEGDDFEFTSKVELKRLNDEFAIAQPVPFILPRGPRQGEQGHMDIQINTTELDAGDYQLLVSQSDGKAHAVEIKVLPSPPEIENLPILANQGASEQHYVIKGKHLDLLAKLQAPGIDLMLSPAVADDSERNVTVHVAPDAKPGSAFPLSEFLRDRSEPLVITDGLRITGPLPVIASSRLSLPAGLPITLNPGEFPAGNTLTALLDVKNLEPRSLLYLTCEGDGPDSTLRIGEQKDKWSLQQLSPDQLFLSYDTSELPAGCAVEVTVDNRSAGRSEPYVLARIVRLPAIDQLGISSDVTSDGKHVYTLAGRNLEMIEKSGWDQLTGFDVSDLPEPVAGSGRGQTLRIRLPDPPTPTANLYIWIRGDRNGRGTTVTAPASGAPALTGPNQTTPIQSATPKAQQALKTATPPQH